MTTTDYNQAVAAFSGRLLRFASKLLQDRDLGADVVQDAFLKLWENKNKVEVTKAKSWLFTTAYRQSLLHIARNKRKTEMTADIMAPEAPSGDLKEVLDRCLQHLPEIQKSVLMLRDYEGYDYKEIGTILELNESQVKVTFSEREEK